MPARIGWFVVLVLVTAVGCGSVDNTKKDAGVDAKAQAACVLDQSKLDSCTL